MLNNDKRDASSLLPKSKSNLQVPNSSHSHKRVWWTGEDHWGTRRTCPAHHRCIHVFGKGLEIRSYIGCCYANEPVHTSYVHHRTGQRGSWRMFLSLPYLPVRVCVTLPALEVITLQAISDAVIIAVYGIVPAIASVIAITHLRGKAKYII